jgi:hypothetical protein
LETKVKFLIEFGKHLISSPAEFGSIGSGLIIKTRMNNPTASFGCALSNIIGCFQNQNR